MLRSTGYFPIDFSEEKKGWVTMPVGETVLLRSSSGKRSEESINDTAQHQTKHRSKTVCEIPFCIGSYVLVKAAIIVPALSCSKDVTVVHFEWRENGEKVPDSILKGSNVDSSADGCFFILKIYGTLHLKMILLGGCEILGSFEQLIRRETSGETLLQVKSFFSVELFQDAGTFVTTSSSGLVQSVRHHAPECLEDFPQSFRIRAHAMIRLLI